jgi:TPR repeat protein
MTHDVEKLKAEAEAGSVVHQSVLGVMYLEGIDVPVDLPEALRLLTLASKRGAPRARYNLARMHHRGLGTPQNISEALSLYEKAADAGEVLAQLALGRMYALGDGVVADGKIAERWYTAAVSQKDGVDEDVMAEAEAFLAGLRFGRG